MENGACLLTMRWSSSPSMCSITRYKRPSSVSPKSTTETTFGWLSRLDDSASREKRERALPSAARSPNRTLMAKRRLMRMWRAR